MSHFSFKWGLVYKLVPQLRVLWTAVEGWKGGLKEPQISVPHFSGECPAPGSSMTTKQYLYYQVWIFHIVSAHSLLTRNSDNSKRNFVTKISQAKLIQYEKVNMCMIPSLNMLHLPGDLFEIRLCIGEFQIRLCIHMYDSKCCGLLSAYHHRIYMH